jgi:hypothetical protein
MSKEKCLEEIVFHPSEFDTYEVRFGSMAEIFSSGDDCIRQLIKDQDSRFPELDSEMKKLQGVFDILRGDIPKLAKKYRDPKFVRLFQPEGCDIVALEENPRAWKKDETAFNCCGWCPWKESANDRVNFCGIGDKAGLGCYKMAYYSPCFLKNLPKDKLKEAINNIRREMREVNDKRERIEMRKEKLLSVLKRDPKMRPLLPRLRPRDWFRDNEEIFIFDWDKSEIIKANIQEVEDNGYIEFSARGVKKSTWYNDRLIMKYWELDFFIENPDFFEWYLKKCNIHEECTKKFRSVLKKEARNHGWF